MTEIPQKEIDYINRTNSSFIGQKIKEVFYEELNYKSEPECWNYSNNVSSNFVSTDFSKSNSPLH